MKVLFFSLTALYFSLPTQALEIQFDYTYDTSGFFADGTDARLVLGAVADFYRDVVIDDLAPIIPVPPQVLDIIFDNPSTGDELIIPAPVIPANTIIIYLGARDLDKSRLGTATTGGWDPFGLPAWLDFVDSRGQVGVFFGSGANETSTWGGNIAVDTLDEDAIPHHWDFSISAKTSTGPHLFSILVHEVAHILGFGLSDAWLSLEIEDEFLGPKSQVLFGGPIPLEPIPLGTKAPSHWLEGTLSTIYGTNTVLETAMDPTLDAGAVTAMTVLDLAGLDDIGWEIAPAPVAPSLTFTMLSNSHFELNWAGDANFNYQVESSRTDGLGSWSPASPVMPGVEDAMNFSRAVKVDEYFHVKVTPKPKPAQLALPAAAMHLRGIPPTGSLRSRLHPARRIDCTCHF